jgi:hypothetical protein
LQPKKGTCQNLGGPGPPWPPGSYAPVQECNPESLADAERTLGFIRQSEPLLPSGSSPGTFALSFSTEATYQRHSPEQTSLEQDKGLSDRKITNRPPMVDSSHGFKAIFTRIVTKYYTPQVDLFASRLNHQLPLYVSRHQNRVQWRSMQ